jgi:hypothetical protein
MNDNDNIVSFPTGKRKEEVLKDRIEHQGFTIPVFEQPYNYDVISFNFDNMDPVHIHMANPKFDYSPILNQPTKLERMMDQCNDLQKRIVYHTAINNDLLLKMIEDRLQELLDLAKLSKNV